MVEVGRSGRVGSLVATDERIIHVVANNKSALVCVLKL